MAGHELRPCGGRTITGSAEGSEASEASDSSVAAQN